jgi:hypothetical protein
MTLKGSYMNNPGLKPGDTKTKRNEGASATEG